MSNGAEFRDDGRRVRGLPPEEVRRLTRLDPVKATLAVVRTYAVIAGCVGAALIWWTPWMIVPAIVIVATQQHGLFIIAHDAAHYRLYRSQFLNELFGRLSAALVGLSMPTYRVIHRLHHNHLYEDKDPDVALHGGYPRGRSYLSRKLLLDLSGANAWKNYAYFFGAPAINDAVGESNRPLDDTAAALRWSARRDRWLVVGLQIAMLVAAAWLGYLLAYILLWVVPALTVLQPILRLRAICEHGAVTDYSTPLTAARTNTGPGWLMWLLFPHHVNHHLEHHVYPAIPHYNLPACHRAMRQHGVFADAEVIPVRETLARVFADPIGGSRARTVARGTRSAR
tara:strand:+ start:73 stop:1092 length:1020 start_codon:yes stop_codon:yes gene_type:complete